MADKSPHRKPALTFVLYGFGVLFAASAAWIAFRVQPAVMDAYEGSTLAVDVVKASAFAALFLGVLCFAFGQALDFLGQTAHNTRGKAATASAARFYYQGSDGQAAGPVTLDELQRLAAGGTIGAATLVCQEGREDWQALGERAA